MAREAMLAGGAAVVVGASLLAAGLVPGILAQPDDGLRESRLTIGETTVASGAASGETVTLTVGTHLRHAGGPAENVTVVYRAVDTDTGLVATTVRREVGTVAAEGEVAVTGNVTVERQGGYRIETIVYEGDRRVETARTTVNGVGTLQPGYAESDVRFQQFGGLTNLTPVQYTVESVEGNRTTLDVSAYLTNGGDAPAGGLRLVVQARQADSNIVADRAEVTVGEVRPGRTVTPSTTLTVPDGYNYYLDAILYRNGVVVGTAQSAANLDPTTTISVNQTRREVDLKVEDFRSENDQGPTGAGPSPSPAASGPGFGVAVAVAALVGTAALVGRRWSA